MTLERRRLKKAMASSGWRLTWETPPTSSNHLSPACCNCHLSVRRWGRICLFPWIFSLQTNPHSVAWLNSVSTMFSWLRRTPESSSFVNQEGSFSGYLLWGGVNHLSLDRSNVYYGVVIQSQKVEDWTRQSNRCALLSLARCRGGGSAAGFAAGSPNGYAQQIADWVVQDPKLREP